jgi:glycosyl hydrolase family 99
MCNKRFRVFAFLLATIAATGYALTAPADEGQVSPRVIAFYYGWYGNPQTDGGYHNWNHPVADKSGRRFPGGEDIGSNFYPQAGCWLHTLASRLLSEAHCLLGWRTNQEGAFLKAKFSPPYLAVKHEVFLCNNFIFRCD